MELTKSSNVSDPKIILLNKLQKYASNYLFVKFISRINSVKSALCLKVGGDEEPSVVPIDDISNKNACYLAALKILE